MNLVKKPFWVVWRMDGGAPTYKHESRQSAELEAERLARNHRGSTFVVLESMCAKVTNDVVSIDFSDDADIPF